MPYYCLTIAAILAAADCAYRAENKSVAGSPPCPRPASGTLLTPRPSPIVAGTTIVRFVNEKGTRSAATAWRGSLTLTVACL